MGGAPPVADGPACQVGEDSPLSGGSRWCGLLPCRWPAPSRIPCRGEHAIVLLLSIACVRRSLHFHCDTGTGERGGGWGWAPCSIRVARVGGRVRAFAEGEGARGGGGGGRGLLLWRGTGGRQHGLRVRGTALSWQLQLGGRGVGGADWRLAPPTRNVQGSARRRAARLCVSSGAGGGGWGWRGGCGATHPHMRWRWWWTGRVRWHQRRLAGAVVGSRSGGSPPRRRWALTAGPCAAHRGQGAATTSRLR